jgi:cysteine desulfurase / selenocysteine lyase
MEKIRSQFPILKQKINNQDLIYFDNAATTQKPAFVIDAISEFYSKYNSNVHRGLNPLADEATEMYEQSRATITDFIQAKSNQEIIFTRNTTESINLVAKTYGRQFLQAGDIVVLSICEHHSNVVPWLQLKEEKGIELQFIPLDKTGKLDLLATKKILADPKVKFLSIQSASNTLGIMHPIKEILSLASEDVVTLVDAAQSISHFPIDVQDLGCDFLAFSGHKMFGPTGIGILYGKKELLSKMPVWLSGGDMIAEVYQDRFIANELPYKFEAGTPNIAGAIGLAAAIKFINYNEIDNAEKELAGYLLDKLSSLDFIEVYGCVEKANHLPTVAFNIAGVHAHDVADILGEQGIIIRAGQHCTQPLHDSLQIAATARVSLSIYNTKQEIDRLAEELEKIYNKFQ